MPEWLVKSFNSGRDLQLDSLIYHLGLAFLLGLAVAGIYWLTHRRDETLAPTFLSTLVLLSILIAMLTQVIGDNLARAFSLAGVLAIVRFRTVVEDSRDTAFVIFAVIVGMAVGADYVAVALAGLVVAGCAAFVMRPRTSAGGIIWTLLVRLGVGSAPDDKMMAIFRQHLEEFSLLATSTGRQGAALDLTYSVRFRSAATPTALVGELNQLEGIHHVELRRV